jgi:hypothetical protein
LFVVFMGLSCCEGSVHGFLGFFSGGVGFISGFFGGKGGFSSGDLKGFCNSSLVKGGLLCNLEFISCIIGFDCGCHADILFNHSGEATGLRAALVEAVEEAATAKTEAIAAVVEQDVSMAAAVESDDAANELEITKKAALDERTIAETL